MAAQLLNTIINETIQNSFGHQVLLQQEAELLKADQGQLSQEQLDNLTQALKASEMGQFECVFWVLLFFSMVLVAAGGNLAVVYIVSTNKEMKSVTNYFLVNLSLADTMVSTLNAVFNFISMLISHWPFGKIYCKISNFIAILSISASVFTLTAISCDRYNAILHPLRPRMSHSHALGWILLIWTLSSALALPNAIYSTLVEDRLLNDNAVTCTMIWPDGHYPLSSYDHIYNIIIMVVTYLVPILTMAILYYKVGKELWGSQAIGENIDKQQRALMAKKKIVKMMIVVVIIFALCWLPYHAFFVVNYYMPTIFQVMPLQYQRYYLIMYWMAMSNSMYNPIIIYFMNSNFRHEFKKILYLVCCCRNYVPQLRAGNLGPGTSHRPSRSHASAINRKYTISESPPDGHKISSSSMHNHTHFRAPTISSSSAKMRINSDTNIIEANNSSPTMKESLSHDKSLTSSEYINDHNHDIARQQSSGSICVQALPEAQTFIETTAVNGINGKNSMIKQANDLAKNNERLIDCTNVKSPSHVSNVNFKVWI